MISVTLTVACLLVSHGMIGVFQNCFLSLQFTQNGGCKKKKKERKENLLSGRFASRYVLLMKEQNVQTGLS